MDRIIPFFPHSPYSPQAARAASALTRMSPIPTASCASKARARSYCCNFFVPLERRGIKLDRSSQFRRPLITIALICVATGFALGTVWAARAAPDVEDDLDTAEDRAAFDRLSRQSGWH
jgi:hypothetical protein